MKNSFLLRKKEKKTAKLNNHKTALVGTRKFLIKKDDYSVVAELDLHGEPKVLKVLSGRSETVKELHELMNNLGSDDPKIWLPHFIDMGLKEGDL